MDGRGRWAPAFAILITAAGCLGASKPAPSPPDVSIPAGGPADRQPPVYPGPRGLLAGHANDPSFPAMVEILVLDGATDPHVVATRTGATFLTGSEFTLKSTDSGRTWSRAHVFATPLRSQDGWDYVTSWEHNLWRDDETNRLFVYHVSLLPDLCALVYRSDDEGQSWEQSAGPCRPSFAGEWRVTMAKPRPGLARPGVESYPNLVHLCRGGEGRLDCAVSHDGGQTFLANGQSGDLGSCLYHLGQPAAGSDGTLFVPAGYSCHRPTVAVSVDNGMSFQVRTNQKSETFRDESPAVAATPDGTAYLVGRGEDGREYLWRSRDRFATFEGPWPVSPLDVRGVISSTIVAGSDGRVAIAYVGNRVTPLEPYTMKYAEVAATGDPIRWHLFVTFSVDAGTDRPSFETIQVTPEEDPVQVGCVRAESPFPGTACINAEDRLSALVDGSGRLYVALTDRCNDERDCPKGNVSVGKTMALAVQDHGPSLFQDRSLLASLGWRGHVHDVRPDVVL